jgi:hypothetical protein
VNKSERDELRRLLKAQFKLLKNDVAAREAELRAELHRQVDDHFADLDKQYDDACFRIEQLVDEANRAVNDIGRELWGREKWGEKYDRKVVQAVTIDKPGVRDKQRMLRSGLAEIEQRVAVALRELDRRENELLMELATAALESADAKSFRSRIPSITDLVPAYRLPEIAG